MAERKQWEMNENQKAFLEALRERGGSATIFELNYLDGHNFNIGSIWVLIKKGFVRVAGERTYVCDVVYNCVEADNVVVGTTKRTVKVFELVNND